MGRAHPSTMFRLTSFALAVGLGLGLMPGAAKAQPGRQTSVSQSVKQVDLYAAARAKILAERRAQERRSAELNAAVAQAKRTQRGAADGRLRALLQDALEVSKQLEASDRKLALLDRMMHGAVAEAERAALRLPPAQRAGARAEVERVRQLLPQQPAVSPRAGVSVTASMDAQALQERADLAGDYEEKLLREAAKAETRMRQLAGQASMAAEAQHLASDRALFDEEVRTMRSSRVVSRTPNAEASGATSAAGGNAVGGGGAAPAGAVGNADGPQTPPGSAGNATDFNNFATDPGTGEDNTQARSSESPGRNEPSLGLGRSQTVVDERTLLLIRGGEAPLTGLSPQEEMAALAARRQQLLQQAARLRALRAELSSLARQAPSR